MGFTISPPVNYYRDCIHNRTIIRPVSGDSNAFRRYSNFCNHRKYGKFYSSSRTPESIQTICQQKNGRAGEKSFSPITGAKYPKVVRYGYRPGFFHHARRILEEVHEAEQVISARQQKLAGSFRISLPMTYGIRRLAPLIVEFQAAHPELTVHIDMNDRYVDVVGEGYDMVLRIGNLMDSTLIARCLGKLPMVICASPDYLRLHGTPLAPSELAQHSCLLYGREGQFGWKLTEENSPNTYAVRGNLSSNNGDVIREAAEAGAGIALLPLFIVEDSLQQGALVQILSDYSPPPLTISALYPKHRQRSAVTRILLPFLAERIAGIVDPIKKT